MTQGREKLRELIAKWRKEIYEYPMSEQGIGARAAVKLCANELEAALATSAGERVVAQDPDKMTDAELVSAFDDDSWSKPIVEVMWERNLMEYSDKAMRILNSGMGNAAGERVVAGAAWLDERMKIAAHNRSAQERNGDLQKAQYWAGTYDAYQRMAALAQGDK